MNGKLFTPFTLIKKFIKSGHDRSVNAKKNILFSFAIKGGSIAISLFLVPLTIHYVNPSQYGIWLTLSSIIGWMGFFDIGFGNGLRNRFAESIAKGEHDQARTYLSTTYAIMAIITSVFLLLFLCINPFLNWSKILNSPPGMAAELSLLALIVFVFFCLQFVLQLISTVLTANQEPSKAALFNFFGTLFSAIVVFVLTKTSSGNLIYLGFVFGLTPVLVLLASSLWFYSHSYRRYAPSVKFVKFSYARDLMSLGVKFFVIQIAVIVLYQITNVIIAQMFGPAEVTPYNIAFKYFSIIPMSLSIVTAPFWSAYTEAWVKQDFDWIRGTVKKLKQLWIFLSVVTILMLVSSNFIYKVWVGKQIVVPLSVSITMAAYVIINAWNGIYAQFFNGVGKIRLQLYSAVWGVILMVPMSIFLGRKFGVAGIILSSALLALINMVWSFIQYDKIINNKATGIWAK